MRVSEDTSVNHYPCESSSPSIAREVLVAEEEEERKKSDSNQNLVALASMFEYIVLKHWVWLLL